MCLCVSVYTYVVCDSVLFTPTLWVVHATSWLVWPLQRKRGASQARMEAFARRSTFFATYEPSVYMPEDFEEEEDGEGSEGTSSGAPSRQEPADILEGPHTSVS